MASFVVQYDVIYHPFSINSQYLMTWGVDSPVYPFLKKKINGGTLPCFSILLKI